MKILIQEHIDFIKDIIRQNFNDNPIDYIKTLLITITGSSRVPANGYSGYPLTIILDDKLYNKSISVHTCYNRCDINSTIFLDSYNLKDNIEKLKETVLYYVFSKDALTDNMFVYDSI